MDSNTSAPSGSRTWTTVIGIVVLLLVIATSFFVYQKLSETTENPPLQEKKELTQEEINKAHYWEVINKGLDEMNRNEYADSVKSFEMAESILPNNMYTTHAKILKAVAVFFTDEVQGAHMLKAIADNATVAPFQRASAINLLILRMMRSNTDQMYAEKDNSALIVAVFSGEGWTELFPSEDEFTLTLSKKFPALNRTSYALMQATFKSYNLHKTQGAGYALANYYMHNALNVEDNELKTGLGKIGATYFQEAESIQRSNEEKEIGPYLQEELWVLGGRSDAMYKIVKFNKADPLQGITIGEYDVFRAHEDAILFSDAREKKNVSMLYSSAIFRWRYLKVLTDPLFIDKATPDKKSRLTLGFMEYRERIGVEEFKSTFPYLNKPSSDEVEKQVVLIVKDFEPKFGDFMLATFQGWSAEDFK